MWCPESGLVLDCICSLSLPSFLPESHSLRMKVIYCIWMILNRLENVIHIHASVIIFYGLFSIF